MKYPPATAEGIEKSSARFTPDIGIEAMNEIGLLTGPVGGTRITSPLVNPTGYSTKGTKAMPAVQRAS